MYIVLEYDELKECAEQEFNLLLCIPIHLLNAENFDTVSRRLSISEDTMQTLKGHVENGKLVILPETELTMGDWSGTGYMVLDPDTYTGQYMVDGGLTGELNGGVDCGGNVTPPVLIYA